MPVGDRSGVPGVIPRQDRDPRDLAPLRDAVIDVGGVHGVDEPNSVVGRDRMAGPLEDTPGLRQPPDPAIPLVDRLVSDGPGRRGGGHTCGPWDKDVYAPTVAVGALGFTLIDRPVACAGCSGTAGLPAADRPRRSPSPPDGTSNTIGARSLECPAATRSDIQRSPIMAYRNRYHPRHDVRPCPDRCRRNLTDLGLEGLAREFGQTMDDRSGARPLRSLQLSRVREGLPGFRQASATAAGWMWRWDCLSRTGNAPGGFLT